MRCLLALRALSLGTHMGTAPHTRPAHMGTAPHTHPTRTIRQWPMNQLIANQMVALAAGGQVISAKLVSKQ